MLDPHTATVLTLDKIWAMCDDLIAEHQKHGLLGEFAPTIPGTGRAYAGTGDRVLAEASIHPVKSGSGDKLEAEIALTNPRTKPFEANLTVDCVSLATRGASGHAVPLHVTIPAGKTIHEKVSLHKPEAAHKEGFAVRLFSASPELFTHDLIFHKRRELAAGGKGAPFELKLAGFPAVEGNLAVRAGTVFLRVAVDDTKINPGVRPWEGSGIELFFTQGHDICQIFLVPQEGGREVRVLDRQLKPIAAIRAQIASHPAGAGYEVSAEIPFSAVDLTHETKFLFDIIVHLSALGDAHSGGRTSLSGQFQSNQNSSLFAEVDFS
jgi:alpha-galactosidase